MMIGANIRKLRLQHEMTQKNLADKLFVSAQAVSRWENDEVEPSIGTILELAKIFDVSADEILGVVTEEAQKSKEKKEEGKHEEDTEQQREKETPFRQFLAACEECNKPIYESEEIVRDNGTVKCLDCVEKRERLNHMILVRDGVKKRIYSFIFGGLACAFFLFVTFSGWNHAFADTYMRIFSLVFSLAMFTFVSCCILDNNFVAYAFLGIANWSIRMPGLIFTFDLDGCLWFIGMKILFAVIGFLLGIVMFLLALLICGFLSLFVYPYAIIINIKRPEYRYI